MAKYTADDLWYFGGNLDGDASICVSGKKDQGQGDGCLIFSMGKAAQSLKLLQHARHIFDGRINTNKMAKDKYQSFHSWTKVNKEAVEFCTLMKDYVQLKKPQFTLACEWPTDHSNGKAFHLVNRTGQVIVYASIQQLIKDDRFRLYKKSAHDWVNRNIIPKKFVDGDWTLEMIPADIMTKRKDEIRHGLKTLKSVMHEPILQDLPAAYFAGMFDSDGCVGVSNLNQVEVAVSQKYRAICDAMKQKYGGGVTNNATVFKWSIKNRDGAMKFIEDILPYSIEKKQQLELVRDMPVNGAPALAKKLREFKGNQGLGLKDKPDRVPQKRLHGLPRYISEVNRNDKLCGYVVQYKKTSRNFASTKTALEKNLEEAKDFLKNLKSGGDTGPTAAETRELPTYMTYRKRDGAVTGYTVKYKKNPSKNFESGGKTLEEHLEAAKKHIETLIDCDIGKPDLIEI